MPYCCSYANPFLLPLESTLKLFYKALKLETVYEMHSMLLGASHFSLPASQVPQTNADHGTVMLAILNVGWLQTALRKHIKPSFLVVNCFGASLLKIIFLSPDVLPVCIRNQDCWLKAKTNFLSNSLRGPCS